MESFSNLLKKISGVSVMALIGESGTGKSFKSKLLAQKYGIDAIIDDGLLIQNDKILGGRSAKTEKTYMGAVRVALFDDKEHRDSVAKILKKSHIKKILLLGTSEKMVIKIATRLQLPPPSKIIKIEDIATREEIDKAIRSRQIEGKHVIPVPAIEIKRNYSQIFYDSIKVFFSKSARLLSKQTAKTFEKSVVTPEFSKKGRVSISEAALTQMTMHCVQEFDSNIRVKKFSIKTNSRGYRLVITIDVPFGKQLTGEIYKLQQYIIENIEKYTGILIEEVSIVIDKITGTDKIKK
jgi:adenylate kinase family enzyme